MQVSIQAASVAVGLAAPRNRSVHPGDQVVRYGPLSSGGAANPSRSSQSVNRPVQAPVTLIKPFTTRTPLPEMAARRIVTNYRKDGAD